MADFNVFASLALIVSISAYIPYLLAVWQGKTKPKRMTWLVWGMVDTIIFGAMLVQNELAPQMLAYVFGAAAILGLSFFKGGEGGWTREDQLVFAGSMIAMALWFFLTANAAIVMSLVAISIGTIPTWKRLWQDPSSEPFLPWVLFLVGGFFGLLAIQEWTLASALGPGMFFLFQGVMVYLSSPFRRAKIA